MPDARATELQCEATIIKVAKQFGWLVHGSRPAYNARGKWQTPIKGHAGFPDLIMIRPPVLYVVELKRKPNRPEPAQVKWLEAFQACGIDAAVVYVPEEQDDLIKLLTARPMPMSIGTVR